MENNLTSWNFSLDTGSAGKDSLYVLACPPLLPTRWLPLAITWGWESMVHYARTGPAGQQLRKPAQNTFVKGILGPGYLDLGPDCGQRLRMNICLCPSASLSLTWPVLIDEIWGMWLRKAELGINLVWGCGPQSFNTIADSLGVGMAFWNSPTTQVGWVNPQGPVP